ncbi:SGNH/GDSL hydrolase family protein [Cohnella nanjingensis]|uniref:SGNH/GDSL hydrolase family protein n=1 Tax=Cohnella nanjingensis TaxID=1387779 RepID=UPI001C884F16|nr:SGNH/GDSL hydrolase family protein [Cohnella nanjingensis]
MHERLREKAADARERAVVYVAMGDSVTQGCMQDGVVEYERVYHQVLKRAIERRYPGTVLNVVNSGVGGDTAEQSRSRWERDVLMYKPDLVTICFGHNDAHGRMAGVAPFVRALADSVGRVCAETEADLLLMTPCMMMKQDNDRVAEAHKPLVADFIKLAKDGILPLYVDAVRQFAAERDIPLLDPYAMWEQMERDGIDIHARLSNGINHPDPEFHAAWGKAMEDYMFSSVRLEKKPPRGYDFK